MLIPVSAAGQYGLITDQPLNELPLNAWTAARNIRFREGAAEKFSGHSPVFEGVLYDPRWLMPVSSAGTALWLYASGTNVGATDGSSHANITRNSGPYTSNPAIAWTGTVIEKIPVINNGVDIPQMWNIAGLATKLQDLSAWPSDVRANTLTSLKRYLVALDVTKAGTRFPTMIKWSHQAPAGALPLTWDHTLPTNDAGEWILPDEGGFLVDGVALRDNLVLYKESETWLMRWVGGIKVFDFVRIFNSIGALSRHCALEFFSGKHLVFTGEDVVLHDGHQAESVISERNRNMLSNAIDLTNYHKSFIAVDYQNNEIWVAFPEPGQELCTRALVWNSKLNLWGSRDLPGTAYITSGIVTEQAAGETWEDAVGTWNTDSVAWKDRTSDPTKRRMLMTKNGSSPQLMIPGVSQQFNGEEMKVLLERQGIGFPLRVKQPPDYTRMKQVTTLWPKINGTKGGAVNVSLGTQESIDGDITWYPSQAYIIGETKSMDFSYVGVARIHAIRFESESNITWRLHGYDADVIDRGMY